MMEMFETAWLPIGSADLFDLLGIGSKQYNLVWFK